jgi:hypothetical protein
MRSERSERQNPGPWPSVPGPCFRFFSALLLLLTPLAAQTQQDDPIVVSSEHPRLFLRPQRLRLLKRERERTSMRWQQFEALIAGNAAMPEPGFAYALYYAVSGSEDAGRRAVAWALGPGADLHQLALVYDWCLPLLSEAQQHELAARMQKRLAETAADESVGAVRSRILAAVALFDEVPQTPQRELERDVRQWWNAKIAPALKSARGVIPRDDAYALLELLHAVRDNTNIDLREAAPEYFKDFPIEHLLSYYPAAYPAAENEYYIGAEAKPGEPDLRLAALSRAAELAMVAFDVNSPETQVLQGWLMHDKFMLRGTLGAPYEFLWANPYQPGLSYYHVPLIYYNPDFGRLFVRSSWEDSAQWFGYFGGVMQMFAEGRVSMLNARQMSAPVSLKEAVICFGEGTRRFQVNLDEEDVVFIVGLEARHTYQVEVDDEEMYEAVADPGGIVHLEDVPRGKAVGIRLKAN